MDSILPSAAASGPLSGSSPSRPKDPVAAARQFEEVLVREFVRTMTKDLFSGSLSGEGGAGWVKAQGEAQADALTDAVTNHLVDSGTLGISDMLIRAWSDSPDGGAGEINRIYELQEKEPMQLEQFMRLQSGGSPHFPGEDQR
ncbi:MAG: peptidoglycan hydrolase [Rhodothermales bacterium]|nr:peptidoglycan hydrolase [Rhodothermales bacterium]